MSMDTTTEEKSQANRIFISYKRTDKEVVFKIKDKVENATREKCWIDLDGIESDAMFKSVIIRAINECEVFLFMYSQKHSEITDFKNDWTIKELNFASKKKKRVVFVNIDGSELSDLFLFDYDITQQIDGRSSESVERLCSDLKKWLNITNTTFSRDQQTHQPSRFVAEKALAIAEENSYLARKLAVEVLPKDLMHPDRPYTSEADRALRKACKYGSAVLHGHTGDVKSAAYSPDGREIVSASRDKTIKVWNAKDFREIYTSTLPAYCTTATFSPNGRTIVVGCGDYNIYLINFQPLQELIDQTRDRFKNNPLTLEERRQYYLE